MSSLRSLCSNMERLTAALELHAQQIASLSVAFGEAAAEMRALADRLHGFGQEAAKLRASVDEMTAERRERAHVH